MQAPGLPSSRVWLGGGCNKKAITQVFRAGHPFRLNGWPPPTLLLAMWTLPLPNFIPQCTGREQRAHGAVFVCFLKRGAHTPSANPAVPGWRPHEALPPTTTSAMCQGPSRLPKAPTQRNLSTPHFSARGSLLLCSPLELLRQKLMKKLQERCELHLQGGLPRHSLQTLPPPQPSPSAPSGRAPGSTSPSAHRIFPCVHINRELSLFSLLPGE